MESTNCSVSFDEEEVSIDDGASTTYTGRNTVKPRVGGPKETRLNRVRLMDTGRYCEAAIARGETIEDVEQMYTLRVNNVWMANEVEIRREFEVYGRLGDVYRPINKDKLRKADFFFVRFMEYEDMVAALKDLQGKYLYGRKMIIQETYAPFELQTSVF